MNSRKFSSSLKKHLNRRLVLSSVRFRRSAALLALFLVSYFTGQGIHRLVDWKQASGKLSFPDFGRILSSAEGNWGLSFQQEGAAPVGNATPEELKKYGAAYVDPTEDKVLYLTFDAGYENGNTPQILRALKKHGVPATFFVVGNFLETSPELAKQMLAEGHTVGNHTYHHPDMSQISSMEAFQKELDDNDALFQKITGQPLSRYYRPPQGKYSTSNLKMAQELGYTTFFWSLAYVDWIQDDQPTKEEAFSKLLTRVHPGAVVLLHSTSSTNAQILDELLTRWEEMGYHFAPLEDLAQKVK